MASTREARQVGQGSLILPCLQVGDSNASKGHDDPYKNLCDDVKSFIKSFYKHTKNNDLTEIENDYVVK